MTPEEIEAALKRQLDEQDRASRELAEALARKAQEGS